MQPKQWTPTVGPAAALRVLAVLAFALLAVGGAKTEEEYVGSDTCEGCHDEVVAAFKTSIHWEVSPEESCEGCHGPGTSHAEEADPELIFRFADDVPPAERNARCLECHDIGEPPAGFAGGTHGLADVACTDCHSPHHPESDQELVAGTPDPCYECHSDVGDQFAPADGDAAGPHAEVTCGECHDPHGRASPAEPNAPCLECHEIGEPPAGFAGSDHGLAGVACIDCHSPHRPDSDQELLAGTPDPCYECHLGVGDQFSPAAKHAAMPHAQVQCLECHDPHGRASPPERDTPCLECHGIREPLAGFAGSDHGLAGVACIRCHSPHRPESDRELFTGSPDPCYECHSGVRAQFSLAESHAATPHALVKCRDCHDPHDRSQRSVLGGFKQQTCLACHTEYRGPWFFEHEVVAVEGCIACHAPHGSVNRRMLTYQRAGDLCLQCHPAQPFTHALNGPGGPRTTRYNRCTDCHTEIHGSNNDALFLN